jgi:hypothetical protein
LLAAQCTGTLPLQAGIRTVSINGRQGQIQQVEPPAPLAPIGQPVFFFQRITYEFKPSSRFPGAFGLFRSVQNGTSEELLAPFDSTARFKYWTAGATASSASAPPVGNIRGVDVVLAARSAANVATKSQPARSQSVATIFFRNVRKN